MRASIVSIALAGGMLALGACAASVEPGAMTRAERAEQCRGVARTELAPTGRQTGDGRQDYRCRNVHVPAERSTRVNDGSRNAAIDRALRSGG